MNDHRKNELLEKHNLSQRFFSHVLQQVTPNVGTAEREIIVDTVIAHLFDHPWVDDETRSAMIRNIAEETGTECSGEFARLLEDLSE